MNLLNSTQFLNEARCFTMKLLIRVYIFNLSLEEYIIIYVCYRHYFGEGLHPQLSTQAVLYPGGFEPIIQTNAYGDIISWSFTDDEVVIKNPSAL